MHTYSDSGAKVLLALASELSFLSRSLSFGNTNSELAILETPVLNVVLTNTDWIDPVLGAAEQTVDGVIGEIGVAMAVAATGKMVSEIVGEVISSSSSNFSSR